jgi:transcriptional regulator with XRE-family HTH domain
VPSDDFGEFLRSRRDLIRPSDLGLPTHGRRRVPGLKRDEVAVLAGVSTDYYTKLEQGQFTGVSESVLDSISEVLRLNASERKHLHRLARPARRALTTPAAPAPRRELLQLLDVMRDVPAVLVGTSYEPLAWNELGDALFGLTALSETGRSFAHHVFLNSEARITYPQWRTVALEVVGTLRFNAGRDPDDENIRAVVGELSVKSAEFRQMWNEHTVREKTFGRKVVAHPVVGMLELAFETFRPSSDERVTLTTYTAEPGSPSDERLRVLASWVASDNHLAGHDPGDARDGRGKG